MLAPRLYYTPPQRAVYRPDALDAADFARLQRQPHLQSRADWRSSRALKQLLPQPRPPFSLAHRKGHAVLLWGAPCVGVDLEYLQARDFVALLPWFADEAERHWFMTQAAALCLVAGRTLAGERGACRAASATAAAGHRRGVSHNVAVILTSGGR